MDPITRAYTQKSLIICTNRQLSTYIPGVNIKIWSDKQSIEAIVNSLPSKKSSGPDKFSGNSIRTSKKR